MDELERVAMTTGNEAVVIGMVRELRVEMTKRFDALDEREDRQDERIGAMETRDAVAVAVAKAAADAAVLAATRGQVRWGRVIAIAGLAGSIGTAVAGLVLRVLHL